jgi:hypothetical protein
VANYTPKTPSNVTTITNNKNPGVGWKFMGLAIRPDVPRQPQAAMDGPVTIVGLPSVIFSPSYLTMDPIAVGGIVLESVNSSATLTVGSVAMVNPYLIGGQLTIQNTGRGILAVNWTQDILVLGQRHAY